MRRGREKTAEAGKDGWLLPLCVDALFLSLLLMGVALCCQSVYGLGNSRRFLVLTAVGLGVLMAAIRALPRFRWVALLLVTESYALFTWLLWDRLLLGGTATMAYIGLVLGGGGTLPDPFPAADGILFLCAALALLALPLGWAALWLRSACAVVAMTYPLLLPAFLADHLPRWPDFLLLLTCWCAMFLTSILPRKKRAARARLTMAALPIAGCVLVLLTLAVPQERYVYPQWAEEAKGVLLSGDLSFSLPDFVANGIQVGGSSSRVDLAGAGPLSLSSRTMLRVETDVPGRIYLRGQSAGVYTGTSWEPLNKSVYEELGDLGGYEPLNFPALTAAGQDWHAVTVELTGAPGNCLYVPYSLLTDADELVGGSFVNDSHIQKGFGVGSYTVYYRPEAEPDHSMRPLKGEAAQAEKAYRDFVYEHYLEVPKAAEQAIYTWADRNIGLHFQVDDSYRKSVLRNYWSEMETAWLIGYALAATTTYDTTVPAMPEGADFVDYFLNQSGKGYCMHYATVATLFFRMIGTPARYVSGYTVMVSDSGQVDVPESAAHAWVEIYLDGYGWYPVEVTPTYGGEETGPEETTEPESTPTPTPTSTPTPAPQTSVAPTPTPTTAPAGGQDEGDMGGDEKADLSALAWLAIVPVLWLLLFIRRRVMALIWRRRLWGSGTNAAALWAYRLQKRLLPWGGREHPEVEELALKARFSQHTLTEAERKLTVKAVEGERDRVDAALPWWKRLAFRWLWALR